MAAMFWLDEELGAQVGSPFPLPEQIDDFCINVNLLVHQVYLDGVVTVVDSKNCLTQMKGGGDPNASGGLSDWLRQVMIVKELTQFVGPFD